MNETNNDSKYLDVDPDYFDSPDTDNQLSQTPSSSSISYPNTKMPIQQPHDRQSVNSNVANRRFLMNDKVNNFPNNDSGIDSEFPPSMLESALKLLEEGFHVIPVRGKKALVKWEPYQMHKPTKDEVEGWWKLWPAADIATVLQPGEVILDIDNPQFAEKIIKEGICKLTRVEQSPNGLHIWLREPATVHTKNENLRHAFNLNADIKAHGGYLVIPPSENYILLSNTAILEVPNARTKSLELLCVDVKNVSREQAPSASSNLSIEEGGRNVAVTKLAGSLFHKSKDFDAVFRCLLSYNQSHCNPPLSDKEVESIARSIYQAELNSSPTNELMLEKKWISLKQLSETVPSTIDWLWDGFLAKGYVTLFSGKPKMGKTSLLFELIKSFLNKKLFIGNKTNLDGKVLILTEENRQLYRMRADKAGISTDDVSILTKFDVMSYGRDEILHQIEWAIEEEGFSLVVIDTLSDFWGVKEENSAPEVQGAVRGLRAIATKHNVSLLLIHHLRKMDGNEGTAVRGSGALMGSIDIGLELYKGNCQTPNRRVIRSNSRFAETPKEIIIELGKDGYKLLGNAGQVTKEDIKDKFIDALNDEEYEPIEAIRKRLDPMPGKALICEVAMNCRNNKCIDYKGEGKRGNPYLYRKLQMEVLT